MDTSRFWKDERLFPTYVAAASVAVLGIQGILSTKLFRRLFFKNTYESSNEQIAVQEQPTSWFGKRGTATIFTFKFTRLLALIALFALTVVSTADAGWKWHNVALVLTSVSTAAL